MTNLNYYQTLCVNANSFNIRTYLSIHFLDALDAENWRGNVCEELLLDIFLPTFRN